MQNRSSWHQQLQKKYLTWYKPWVLIKALDLAPYPHQSWKKLRMRFLFLSWQSITNFFENGIFPNLLKSAKKIPLFKNGSKLSCNYYRPISPLSNIGKTIEILIQHKVFYALQFGFRLNTSTNNALMSITENMQTHLR